MWLAVEGSPSITAISRVGTFAFAESVVIGRCTKLASSPSAGSCRRVRTITIGPWINSFSLRESSLFYNSYVIMATFCSMSLTHNTLTKRMCNSYYPNICKRLYIFFYLYNSDVLVMQLHAYFSDKHTAKPFSFLTSNVKWRFVKHDIYLIDAAYQYTISHNHRLYYTIFTDT